MARAALVAATWAPLLPGPAASAGCAGLSAAGLRLNHAQVLATHNSYHAAPADSIVAVTPEWNYTHPPLDTQLDRGVRSFELDVFYDAAADVLKVMHIPGSDEASNCETLPDCLQLASSWSKAHPGHFPLHFIVEMINGVESSENSSSGCLYSDLQPAIPCVEENCAGSPFSGCLNTLQSKCIIQVYTVISANSQCSSIIGCLGPAMDAYHPDHVVTSEDVENVLRECTSKVTNQGVPLDSAGQSDALAAVRAALDATFPAASRIVPEDVQRDDSEVYVWPEVDSSRGKAMFYVSTPSSWGQGDSAGFYFGNGGAIVVENDPSSLTGVASGKWVRTRVDEQLQLDAARQAQALAGGAHVLSTDFPPRVGPSSWAALAASTAGVFWIPGGVPVGCNPVTVPDGVECSAALLEDLASDCEVGSTSASTTPGAAVTSELPTVVCTADVKECADGSFVSRDSANECKWEACPQEPAGEEEEEEEVDDFVVVQMLVTGIDYSLLVASSDLLDAFKEACIQTAASAAGVEASNVVVELSEGSWNVIVLATISVLEGQTVADIENSVASWRGDTLAGQISEISGIDAVTNGEPITGVGPFVESDPAESDRAIDTFRPLLACTLISAFVS